MATRISEFLGTAAGPAVAVVRGVTDQDLDGPTPCAGFQVRDLLNHLFQVVVNFQALAARQPAEWADKPEYLQGDWRDRFGTEVAALVDAWSDPAALEGVSPAMGLPQPAVGRMALLDLTVHGWDLARATGQPFVPEPAVVAEVAELVVQLGPQARTMGVFGEPVPVASDAAALDRLLGSTGRDPAWTPAGRG